MVDVVDVDADAEGLEFGHDLAEEPRGDKGVLSGEDGLEFGDPAFLVGLRVEEIGGLLGACRGRGTFGGQPFLVRSV